MGPRSPDWLLGKEAGQREGAAGTAGAAVTAQACFTEILKACSEDGVG